MDYLNRKIRAASLDMKLSIDIHDEYARTALNWMSQHNDAIIVSRLINYGANINKTDENGWTPLHIAALNKSYAAATIMLLRGANVNAKTTQDFVSEHSNDDSEEELVQALNMAMMLGDERT